MNVSKAGRLLWLVSVIIVIWLLVLDFVPSGRLEVAYNFEHVSPFISRLSPDGRVLPIRQNEAGEHYQPMVIEPVYFDVRLPQAFEKAHVEMMYQKPSATPLRIGYRTHGGDWSWVIQAVEDKGEEGLWMKGVVDFDLRGAQYIDRQLRFILASPGLEGSSKEIKVHRIEMTFEKEPLSRENLWERTREYVKTWIK